MVRHPAFWGVALVHFGCCAAHSGPIFHMVAHAMDLGVTKMAAASMLGLSGATSIIGRLSSGVLADRLGAKPALVGMLALQAVALSTYLYAGGAVSLFVVAVAFGVSYGGAMPLYALVAREFFGERVVGTTFGGIFFLSCIGMGLGAYGGGFLFDHLGTYWSLHARQHARRGGRGGHGPDAPGRPPESGRPRPGGLSSRTGLGGGPPRGRPLIPRRGPAACRDRMRPLTASRRVVIESRHLGRQADLEPSVNKPQGSRPSRFAGTRRCGCRSVHLVRRRRRTPLSRETARERRGSAAPGRTPT